MVLGAFLRWHTLLFEPLTEDLTPKQGFENRLDWFPSLKIQPLRVCQPAFRVILVHFLPFGLPGLNLGVFMAIWTWGVTPFLILPVNCLTVAFVIRPVKNIFAKITGFWKYIKNHPEE